MLKVFWAMKCDSDDGAVVMGGENRSGEGDGVEMLESDGEDVFGDEK